MFSSICIKIGNPLNIKMIFIVEIARNVTEGYFVDKAL